MKIYYLLIPFLFMMACSSESKPESPQAHVNSTNTETHISVKRSNMFESYTDDKKEIADFIENYLNTMYDSSLQVRNNSWHSEMLTDQQDFFLRGGLEKGFLLSYPPEILGIKKQQNNRFVATLCFSQNNSPYKIMDLQIARDALNRPYFIDNFGENLKAFTKKKNGLILFYYSPLVSENIHLEKKSIDFNLETARFFDVSPKNISVIALKDLRDYCDVLGYVYSPFLTYDSQTGGIAIPGENIIFSANNSPYYPHELVHIYTSAYNAHSWFDEGLATYFAGSTEHTLEHHLKKIASQMNGLDFSQIPENHKIDDDTSYKYAIGGLLCKLAMEEYGGKKAVMQLMNSGKSKEDFHLALKNVFRLNENDYDSFIRKKLKKYVS